MLYIKCDTRDMNYAVSSVCADEPKAHGRPSRILTKKCNELQVHSLLMEDKKHPSMQIFAQVFSFREDFTTFKKNGFPEYNSSKFDERFFLLYGLGSSQPLQTCARTHNARMCAETYCRGAHGGDEVRGVAARLQAVHVTSL